MRLKLQPNFVRSVIIISFSIVALVGLIYLLINSYYRNDSIEKVNFNFTSENSKCKYYLAQKKLETANLGLVLADGVERNINVELATNSEQHRIGLMGREKLESDGMLFIFNEPKIQSFWMKDTCMNLDIMFFDEKGNYINGYFDLKPCVENNCESYKSKAPAKYVLELPAGKFDKDLINENTKLIFKF